MDIKSKVDKEENEQLRSIPAQRLIEKLSLLKNRIAAAKRRWFWELLQNASDYNSSVNVKLVVSNDKVTFMHDGSPFSLRDALNLISPDSNKQSDEIHKDNIGKFGTGLVSTHILSSVMDIDGLCIDDENSCYNFHLTLDRSCFGNKQELIEQITQAKEKFKESLVASSHVSGFQTAFTYTLNRFLPTLAPIQASELDLNYLYEILPYTLCFMPKVKSVKIEDNRSQTSVREFSIGRDETKSDKICFKIVKDGSDETLQFAYFERDNVSTAFMIKEKTICAFPNNLSKVFCGLPLIGTEDIGLPFVLNSLKFEPTTEREGVELEPGSNETNRALFKTSILLYKDVLDYVSTENLDFAYNLTNILRKYNGTQASNQQFYQLYLSKYKEEILAHTIVRNTKGNFVPFSSVIFPFKDSKIDKSLYRNALMLKSNYLPCEADYEKWFSATDFTLFTEQKYTHENLAKEIDFKNNVYSFGNSVDEIYNWLWKCAEYFKECDRYIFSRYKLLPNQNGDLCKVAELHSDLGLPVELKMIYNSLFSKKQTKIETCLLNKTFNNLEICNQEYTTELLAKSIDNELSAQYSDNQGNTSSISIPLNNLYSWINSTDIAKENLAAWFHWYYPKRATLIVDMLTEVQREQALVIAQSGKMEALANLASSDLTDEEINLIIANIKRLPTALTMLNAKIDDKEFADSNEGDIGEEIVYKDLLLKYPRTKGYTIVWASRDRNEPCYDFEILKNGQPYAFCDAKTTRRGIANSDSIPFFMRMSQWHFLQELDDSLPYFIARVFIKDGGRIKYIRISRTSLC